MSFVRISWRMRAAAAAAGCAALVLAGPGSATADPGGLPHLQRVSPGDPFASCTVGATPNGYSAPSSEVEPDVSVDPHHANHAIAVFQQDRWTDGGARGLVASVIDGGHVVETPLPFTRCATGSGYERGSDAWVSYGPDGAAYASGLVFDVSDPDNGVAAATSFDGGLTWQHAQPVIADTDPAVTDDKNSVTADPLHPGTAYQVWDRIRQVPSGPGAVFDGPAYLAITHDHGATWSQARPFVDTSAVPNSQTIGNVIVPDARTGTLHDFFEWITYSDPTGNTAIDSHFAVVTSTDGGQTWSRPVTVAKDTSLPEVDPNAPTDSTKALRAGSGLPSPAIDPRTGELYMAYEGTDFTGGAFDDVQMVHSTDGGLTWSAPARVNQVAAAPAFTPSVAVAQDGTVGVTYDDLRFLPAGDTTTLPTATWLVTFPGGDTSRPSERQVTPVFDWEAAPYAGWGHFLGDYQSLVPDHGSFRAAIVTANSGQPQNSTDAWTGVFKP